MTQYYNNDNSRCDDIKINLYAHVHHGSIIDIFEIAVFITLQESALSVGICLCTARFC